MKRAPSKRKIKPTKRAEFDFNDDESSDDSDFRIEDHNDDSDCFSSSESNKSSSDNQKSEESHEEPLIEDVPSEIDKTTVSETKSVHELVALANNHFRELQVENVKICCICLGDKNEDDNEIIECDKCKITLHEDCYGIQDDPNGHISLTQLKDAWFCDSCTAGVEKPYCDLCPNLGGAFKETDSGRWVHLICALYIPGITFKDFENLSNITLFDLSYKKWSAKVCTLCDDFKYSRTGICIGCDAGLCKTYFHVSCAQKYGLLVETYSENYSENQVDPFYAHCKLHSDKDVVLQRRRLWLMYQSYQKSKQQEPINRIILDKLETVQEKSKNLKVSKTPFSCHFDTKCSRLLISSASACRSLYRKAELKQVNQHVVISNNTHVESNFDLRRKCAFSTEFVSYYLERNIRMKEMKNTISTLMDTNKEYLDKQQELHEKYAKLIDEHTENVKNNKKNRNKIDQYFAILKKMCPNKHLPKLDSFEIKTNIESDSFSNKCDTCKEYSSQHLLVKCDTCKQFYHLGCLDPPLKRLPKKIKGHEWQCSRCDMTDLTPVPDDVIEVKGRRVKRPPLKRQLAELKLDNDDDVVIIESKKSKVVDNDFDDTEDKIPEGIRTSPGIKKEGKSGH